jgi:hypothetical protein
MELSHFQNADYSVVQRNLQSPKDMWPIGFFGRAQSFARACFAVADRGRTRDDRKARCDPQRHRLSACVFSNPRGGLKPLMVFRVK